MKDFAMIAKPLFDLERKDVKYKWTDKTQKAFEKLKAALISCDVMAHPNSHKVYDVIVDASGYTVGGVLQQEGRPIAYISRSLNPHEKNYPTHEQEVLALIYAIKKWSPRRELNP